MPAPPVAQHTDECSGWLADVLLSYKGSQADVQPEQCPQVNKGPEILWVSTPHRHMYTHNLRSQKL